MPTTITVPSGGVGSGRELVTSNRTYYVATTGNDGAAGTIGAPFLTIQHAVDVVAGLDLADFQVTIQVATGTYAEQVIMPPLIANRIDPAILKGDETTPANCLIDWTSGDQFDTTIDAQGNWKLTGFKIKAPTDGSHIFVSARAQFVLGRMSYESTTDGGGFIGQALLITTDSSVVCTQNQDMSGAYWATPFSIGRGSRVSVTGCTVTIAGTPAWASALIEVSSSYTRFTATFSGSATGSRYYVSYNGVLNTGLGATYFPGDVAGTVDTGGQYD